MILSQETVETIMTPTIHQIVRMVRETITADPSAKRISGRHLKSSSISIRDNELIRESGSDAGLIFYNSDDFRFIQRAMGQITGPDIMPNNQA